MYKIYPSIVFQIIIGSFLSATSYAKDLKPNVKVYFNEPGLNNEKTSTLDDVTRGLINKSSIGSDIYISAYMFTNLKMAKALLKAHNERAVNVNVIIGSKGKGESESVEKLLLDGFGAYGPLKNCSTRFDNSQCVWNFNDDSYWGKSRGNGKWFNHNKFFIFSQLNDGRKNIVIQSTANPEDLDGRYQDSLVVSNDASLFKVFKNYWMSLVDKKDKWKKSKKDFSSDSGVTAHFYPRPKKDDIYVKELQKVYCKEGGYILLAHSSFSDSRKKVAKLLRKKSDEGCYVKVIGRENYMDVFWPSPGMDIHNILISSGLMELYPYREKLMTVSGVRKKWNNTVHNKLMIINAPYKEDILFKKNKTLLRRKIVFTGSHNLDGYSQTGNDEVLLRVEGNHAVFSQYLSHWAKMYVDLLEFRKNELGHSIGWQLSRLCQDRVDYLIKPYYYFQCKKPGVLTK